MLRTLGDGFVLLISDAECNLDMELCLFVR